MAHRETLEEQRQRARLVAGRIVSSVDRHVPGETSTLLVSDIARLTGMLAIHCAQVHRLMLANLDMMTSRSAARIEMCRFRQQFGGLVDLSRIFHRRWGTSAAIDADPVDFRIAVHQLVYAIEEYFGCEQAAFEALGPVCEAGDARLAEAPLAPPIRALT